MGSVYSTNRERRTMHTGFWWESQKERPVERHRLRSETNKMGMYILLIWRRTETSRRLLRTR
jgi:hypothetical protein